jgi:hypothetical protein
MTFLAEAVDLPRRKSGIRVRIYSAPPIHQLFVRNHLSVLSQPHRVGYLHDLIYGNLSRNPRV